MRTSTSPRPKAPPAANEGATSTIRPETWATRVASVRGSTLPWEVTSRATSRGATSITRTRGGGTDGSWVAASGAALTSTTAARTPAATTARGRTILRVGFMVRLPVGRRVETVEGRRASGRPSPTETEHQVDPRVEALAGHLDQGALGVDAPALGLEQVDERHQPGAVALLGQLLGPAGLLGGFGQRRLPLGQQALGGEGGLHLAERLEHLAGVGGGRLVEAGAGRGRRWPAAGRPAKSGWSRPPAIDQTLKSPSSRSSTCSLERPAEPVSRRPG